MNRMPYDVGQYLKEYFATHHSIPVPEVEAVVKVADQVGSEALSRLDAFAFGNIFGILRVSEGCLAQQRGLCLLTVRKLSLAHTKADGSRNPCKWERLRYRKVLKCSRRRHRSADRFSIRYSGSSPGKAKTIISDAG